MALGCAAEKQLVRQCSLQQHMWLEPAEGTPNVVQVMLQLVLGLSQSAGGRDQTYLVLRRSEQGMSKVEQAWRHCYLGEK